MDTIFINSKNSKTDESNRFRLYLSDRINLKNKNKTVTLVNMSVYYTLKNMKEEYNNNKFKTTAPTWDETFSLPDGLHSVSDIQDYFLHIIKKHEPTIKTSEGPPVLIY